VCENAIDLEKMAQEFYEDLYKFEGTIGIEEVLSHVPRKVTREMNAELLAPYSELEVKNALFQMFPTKAPGPDGFPAHFFQKHWNLCGKDITRIVIQILNGEDSPEEINETLIVLIPKVKKTNHICLSSDLLPCAMWCLKLHPRYSLIG
jgi:hypothetical protein